MASRLSYVALICVLLLGSGWPSLRARTRTGVRPNLRAAALVHPNAWEPEPVSPAHVEPLKLARALRALCGMMPKGRAELYAETIVANATRHGEDPFLLAALVYRMSRCLPDARNSEGIGLTGLPLTMYREEIRGRMLRYPVEQGGALVTREKELSRVYMEQTLLLAEPNLEWAAALLAMWREQHATIDAHFPQQPHRHYVSHFVWGDRVKSARAEDRIMTDRRRLLAHYGVPLPEITQTFRGVSWGTPLEGAPRVVSSRPGADRDEGLRAHRGIDIEASFGEPVLALADGRVSFAGVDYPGLANNAILSPAQIASVPRASLGRGGRYVCVTHLDAHGDEAWLRSCSMHLEEVRVRAGQRVKRGEVIGTVGRTGMARSAPHLHLELLSDKRLYDAREVLKELLVGEPPADVRKKRKKRHYLPLAPALDVP